LIKFNGKDREMKTRIFALALLGLLFTAVAMAVDDPFIGTWKLNLVKSQYPSGLALKSETVRNEAKENGIRQVFEGIGADGKPFRSEYVGIFDGKDYPITGYSLANTMAYTRIDANTLDILEKKDGKVVRQDRLVISKNGKMCTVTEKGKDSKGQDVTVIEVYDRQ
jgi:hypothetical protein